MSFTFKQSKVRKIDRNDRRFWIQDEVVVVARAGFEISQSCPAEYKSIFITAINAGWLKPIAHVYERELLFMGLADK